MSLAGKASALYGAFRSTRRRLPPLLLQGLGRERACQSAAVFVLYIDPVSTRDLQLSFGIGAGAFAPSPLAV